MSTSRERLRASDAERDAVVERLRHAATEGRLAADELDERLAGAFAARTYGDLDALIDDLPIPVPAPPPPRLQRAGFGPRLGAWVIDGVVVVVLITVLSHLLHGLGFGLALLASAGYFTAFEGGSWGGGLGKQAMRLRVVDARGGGPIGYPRALLRWFVRILSALPLYLGYFWMLGDPDRQCWHDKLAGDVVVFADGRTEPAPIPEFAWTLRAAGLDKGAADRDATRLPPRSGWY